MENKLTLFAVKSTEPVEIVFEKTIDNIKEVNQKYVTSLLYECSDETNKKTMVSCCHLQLERRRYAVAAKRIGFELDD